MCCEIYWNHRGREINALPADVYKIAQKDKKLHIHFKGHEPAFGEVFSGVLVLVLLLADSRQSISSFYTSIKNGQPSSEKKVHYTLNGCFLDSSFSEFHGIWVEEGEEYEFGIIDILVDEFHG
jgi:hypothetical protein